MCPAGGRNHPLAGNVLTDSLFYQKEKNKKKKTLLHFTGKREQESKKASE